MEIKDRLIKMITSEGLNSSAFADSIGVQRSSISHILSGRNKPSIDFLEKILSSYPKYNAEWLIMGTGEISKTPKQSSLFDDMVPPQENPQNSVHSVKPETNVVDPKEVNKIIGDNPDMSVIKPLLNEEPPMSYSSKQTHDTNVLKAVDRIVIFYSDRTFYEYVPGK